LRLLAFDTSGPTLSVVAAEAGEPVARRDEALDRGHAERLLPLLGAALVEAGWSWRDLDLIAVATGPGNFTGIRAGIAVARALVLALQCRALGIGTLEIIAESAGEQALAGQWIDAVLDARRDEVYVQRFTSDMQVLTPPALVPMAEFARRCPSGGILVGDVAARLVRAGETALPGSRDALTMARLVGRRMAEGAEPVPPEDLRPVYVRPPDARLGAGASLISGTV
jgi:tRNA threonylcarbamoyladenosine biosynthesis protein TsaB